jgi:hypothetical protein
LLEGNAKAEPGEVAVVVPVFLEAYHTAEFCCQFQAPCVQNEELLFV